MLETTDESMRVRTPGVAFSVRTARADGLLEGMQQAQRLKLVKRWECAVLLCKARLAGPFRAGKTALGGRVTV